MPSKETTISLNCATNQAFEIALKAISQVSDIADYASNSTELAIQARTAPSMKTYGDDIFIKISGSDKQSSIYIVSETDNQVVDWGRNAQNIENILAQINNIVSKTLEEKQEEAEAKHEIKQESETSREVTVVQQAPVTNGHVKNHAWIWGVIGVISLVLILYFNGVFSSNSSSYSNTSSSYTITSFTSARDVLNFIDGKSIYTSLGNLYVKNGSVYDGSGAYVNDIIVDSYTANSATISIYPTQYSGYAMKFKVDRATGTISREN